MNRLKSYVRRTILKAAREYSHPAKRRTLDGTKAAFIDAMRGTDTGWWSDLIYTAPMLVMAHRYREDIATALEEYESEVGESFTYRSGSEEVPATRILIALLARRKAYTFDDYREARDGYGPEAALIGLRFAVEWYAGTVARDLGLEL